MAVVDEAHGDDTPGRSLRAAVVAAGAVWSAGQRRLLQLVTELDRSGDWAADGSPTCAHWVADALAVEVCTAREWLRIGRALGRLHVLDDAFAQGRLSYSKVRTLTRVVTPENQEELCELAERVPAGRLGHALATWQQRHETPTETELRQHRARYMTWRTDADGSIVGSFRLPPVPARHITEPIDALILQRRPAPGGAAASADAWISEHEQRWPSVAQQRADALVEIVRGGGATVVTEVVIHVRGDGCTLDDGTPVADSVVERIAPEAFLRALIHDAEGHPVNASGRQRHPTNRQRRVVQARDRACVDCGATEFLQYDHDPEYSETHHTIVDESYLRCWPCHRERHRRQRG